MKGKVILIPFPYTDLTVAKLRPAMVIFEGRSDFVVAFITSKISDIQSDLDVLIMAEDPEFYKTGLKD